MCRCVWFLLLLAYVVPCEAKESRIVCVGGVLTEILYTLGAGHLLVGSDISSTYPEVAKKLPKVGYVRTLSAEGILSLAPDLVIITDQAGPQASVSQIKSTGVDMLVLKSPRSLDDVQEVIKVLAAVLERVAEGERLIEKIEQEAKVLSETVKQQGRAWRVLFILHHGTGAPMVAGVGTAADHIITLSGGKNVVTTYKGYKALTPESSVALKPDIILMTKRGLEQFGGKERLVQHPGLSLTTAVQNGRIIAMDALFLLGFGPRTIEAALALHRQYQVYYPFSQ